VMMDMYVQPSTTDPSKDKAAVEPCFHVIKDRTNSKGVSALGRLWYYLVDVRMVYLET